MAENAQVQERGFEYNGVFYPWMVSDQGADLQIIDRITGGMLPQQFFGLVDDETDLDRLRGPVIMALVGTSIRHKTHWSVERVVRMVQDMSYSQLEWVGPTEPEADEEPADAVPPSQNGDDGEASPESSSTSNESPEETSKKPSETQS